MSSEGPCEVNSQAGPGVEWLAGSGEKAAAACLFSSQRGGQQRRHRFGSVNVSQRANISGVSLRNCKLRTHWAMHDPAGAGLHREQQLPPPNPAAELRLAWPFSRVISQMW